jgi:hypothetical protein
MNLAGDWQAQLRPDEDLTPASVLSFAQALRDRKLTFGDRLHCPFLRPFDCVYGGARRTGGDGVAGAAGGPRHDRA